MSELKELTYADLQECRRMQSFITDMTERLAQLESQIEKITTAIKQSGGSGGNAIQDKMAEDIAVLLDFRDQLWDAIIERKNKVETIRTFLAILPPDQKRIMELRYFDGLTWNLIAQRTFYDKRHCFRLHREALIRLGIVKNQEAI